MAADKISKHSLRHYSSYHTTYGKNPTFRHIKSNNSGTANVKIVKNERDPPLFKSKQLIGFVYSRSRIIGLDMTENIIFTHSAF
jgi:hypothetical protein